MGRISKQDFYEVFLQTPGHSFRPKFTVLSHPGQDYVGGDDFFADDSKLVNEFDLNDISILAPGPEVIESKYDALRQSGLACVLGQALGIGRYVVHDPMYPNHLGCFRIGCVRIIDNQDETFGAVGDTLPR
jgi:hypothetical protein